MGGRRVLGMVAALAVVVPAVALADAAEHQNQADSLLVVQQHSVFVEIFIFQDNKNKTERHPFGAIVGLVKECERVVRRFDNAVMWFNDQFLFGNKFVNDTVGPFSRGIRTPLGQNVAGKFLQIEETVDVGDPNDGWRYTAEDCFDQGDTGVRHGFVIPDMFVGALPVMDPDLVGNNAPGFLDRNTILATLTELDNSCFGCVFDYISSFFIVDPNGHRWLIDKYAYPLCLVDALGELDDAFDLGGLIESDPADVCGERHADMADDYNPPAVNTGDEENHCLGSGDTPGEDLCDMNNPAVGSYQYTEDPGDGILVTKEPLWVTHLQVDVDKMGFRDEAPWKWSDVTAPGVVRPGTPRYDAPDTGLASDAANCTFNGAPDCVTDGTPEVCPAGNVDVLCSIEYDFVLVVDFAMFDNGLSLQESSSSCILQDTDDQNRANQCLGKGSALDAADLLTGAPPEYIETCKEHGTGGANEFDSYLVEGNSHPHNPITAVGAPVQLHPHDCVVVDIIPMEGGPSEQANPMVPYFTQAYNLWQNDPSNKYGRPPMLNADCDDLDMTVMVEDPVTGEWTDGVAIWDANLDLYVAVREFEVCDVDDDAGEYFVDDPFPTVPPDDNLFP